MQIYTELGRYYITLGGDNFFCFEPEDRPKVTSNIRFADHYQNLAQAVGMLQPARVLSSNAIIINASLTLKQNFVVAESDIHEIKKEIALAKLTKEDKEILGL